MTPIQRKSRRSSRPASRFLPAIAGGKPIRTPERPLIFGTPVLGKAELSSVAECLQSGWIGAGPRVARFEKQFAEYKHTPYAIAVSSGTAAIHLSLLALGIGPGDEVIAPTMTFCSTVHSVIHSGATPVLVDCNRASFNCDPQAIQKRITSRTKAILVVHMCGRCCQMDPILKLARRNKLAVIEDCAHAIESSYHGRPAGTLGDAGCFSFYPTKNVTTGDGGMVITPHKRIAQHVKALSLHGMNADAWARFSGIPGVYRVERAGFKYNMTDIAASLGSVQLSAVERRWKRRQYAWRTYDAQLSKLPLVLPPAPEQGTRHACHLYTPLLPLEGLRVSRDRVLAALRAENIFAGIHYVPVHQQPYYRKRFRLRSADFPNATFVGSRTISLPLTAATSGKDVSDVRNALERILGYFGAGNTKQDE